MQLWSCLLFLQNSAALANFIVLCNVDLVVFFRNQSLLTRMRGVIRDRGGIIGLYRGLGPGTIRSFISNGASMTVMVQAQKKVTEWGWRDDDTTLAEEED